MPKRNWSFVQLILLCSDKNIERFINLYCLSVGMVNIPNIVYAKDLANTFMANRLQRHPGPYEIGFFWKEDINKIFPGITGLIVPPTSAPIYGEMNESETWLLQHIVAWQQPKVMVEIGTLYGRSTAIMAKNSPLDARILTVDLPIKARQIYIPPYSTDTPFVEEDTNRIGEKYREIKEKGKIRKKFQNATKPAFKKTLDDFLDGKTIDFALIDAAHDYGTTKTLFEVVYNRLSPGGIIMTDDYAKLNTHIGVTRYFSNRAEELVFYWFNPSKMGGNKKPVPAMNQGDPRQSAIFFINLPEAHVPWQKRGAK